MGWYILIEIFFTICLFAGMIVTGLVVLWLPLFMIASMSGDLDDWKENAAILMIGTGCWVVCAFILSFIFSVFGVFT